MRKVKGSDDGVGGRGKRPNIREKGGGGGGGGGEIFKANYSVFWVSERRGRTPPNSTSKVSRYICTNHRLDSNSKVYMYVEKTVLKY